jgi:glycosyltransferase involved in cell wall biosynthesis
MKILHLSDDSLPDWRVEKSALSASNIGHQVIFAGKRSQSYHTYTFSRNYDINWTERSRRGFPFYWHSVKKQVERVLREVRPDIVHAHNIVSAKIISELDYPFVYDDHESWSEFPKILAEADLDIFKPARGGMVRRILRRAARNYLKRRAVHVWTNWQKEIISSRTTITVSDKIAEDLRITGNTDRVFVVPNFPMRSEVKDFGKPQMHVNLASVYAGVEARGNIKAVNRDINGLAEMFILYDIGSLIIVGTEGKSPSDKIRYTGLLTRRDMFDEMFKNSIGLIPWKRHWSHVFVNPNKAYEYAHAGLFVMCTASLKTIKETLKDNCMMFEDYDELASQLEYFRDHMEELYAKRIKTFEFARNNLIWENYEKNIFQAYQLC